MIINIRGVSGSGKTAIARRILGYKVTEANIEYEKKGAHGRINRLKWPIHCCRIGNTPVFVLGRYDVPQGGCDTEKNMDCVASCIQRCIVLYGGLGHIVFEGMLVSSSGNRFLTMAQQTGPERWLWALLRPPIQVCINRLLARNGNRPVLDTWMYKKQRSIDLFENRVRHLGVGRVLNLFCEGSPTDYMDAILEAAK